MLLVYGLSIFLCLKSPDQTLTGWTLILIVLGDVNKIPLAKATLGQVGRYLWPWQIRCDLVGITGQDLFTFEVPAISHYLTFICADGLFGLS